MLARSQIITVKTYQRLAGLSDIDYRDLLRRHAGVHSCKQLSQDGFDRVMPALEAVLWERVTAGLVKQPPSVSPNHWRSRCPAAGMLNSRQRHRIERLWEMLGDYLPRESQTEAYLAGIVARAAGAMADDYIGPDGWIAWERIPAEAGRLAITALQDRLKHAVAGVAA